MTGRRPKVRVRKARRTGGVCGICRTTLTVGTYIANPPDIRGWCHVRCLVRRCEVCGQRLQLDDAKAGGSVHPMCAGQPEPVEGQPE